MYLVKFTSNEWKNKAISGDGLKIGTTKHYREIEDEKFRDEEEGGARIIFRPGGEVSGSQFNRIFKHEGAKIPEALKIDLIGTSLQGERSQFNTYVYCCSWINDLSEIEELSERFNSDTYYSISDPTKFRNTIGQELEQVIKQNCVDNLETNGLSEDIIETIRVLPMLTGILYSDRQKERIVTADNIDTFEPRIFDVVNFFQKPTRFEGERELRFLWPATWQLPDEEGIQGISIIEDWRIVGSKDIGIDAELVELNYKDVCDNHGKPVRPPMREHVSNTSLAKAMLDDHDITDG